jgi:hypothetical protein
MTDLSFLSVVGQARNDNRSRYAVLKAKLQLRNARLEHLTST